MGVRSEDGRGRSEQVRGGRERDEADKDGNEGRE